MNESFTNEAKSLEIIQTIGDLVVKSIEKYETVTINKGIKNLTNIAIHFLDLKSKNEKKYEVSNPMFFEQTKPKNQYVTYVTNEFEKIFVAALRRNNTNANQFLIQNLSSIVDKTFTNKNNYEILEQLIESRGYFGSLYWSLFQHAIKFDATTEKSLLINHLIAIPELFILTKKYYLQYLDNFIDYHLFRVLKLIIDNDDFETFKQVVDRFSKTLEFKNPVQIVNDIAFRLYPSTFIIMDPDIEKKLDSIRFFITHKYLTNFNTLEDFYEQLDSIRQLILQKHSENTQLLIQVDNAFTKIIESTLQLHVCTKIYGVFYRIGAYLIYKNEDYARYIGELWYHVEKSGNTTIHINKTPVLDDPIWQTLYAIYEGQGTTIDTGIDRFDDYLDSKSFLYQYSVLLMLKTKQVYTLPNKEKLLQYLQNDQNDELQFFYDLANTFPVTGFLNAYDKIKSNSKLLHIINLENTEETITDRLNYIKEQLENLANKKNETITSVEKNSAVNEQRLEEVISKIKSKYLESSITDKISKVSYDPSIQEITTLHGQALVPRSYFVDSQSIAKFLIDPARSDIANLEEKTIHNLITNTIEPIQEDSTDFYLQIKNVVIKLKERGFNPNVIFIPISIQYEMYRQDWKRRTNDNTLVIDDVSLLIVHSWKGFNFDNIIIFDSEQLEVVYKAKEKTERISITPSGTEPGTRFVIFSSKTELSCEIRKHDAFIQLINNEIKNIKK